MHDVLLRGYAAAVLVRCWHIAASRSRHSDALKCLATQLNVLRGQSASSDAGADVTRPLLTLCSGRVVHLTSILRVQVQLSVFVSKHGCRCQCTLSAHKSYHKKWRSGAFTTKLPTPA